MSKVNLGQTDNIIRQCFIQGVKERVRDMLDEECSRMIEEMHQKVAHELRTISKEAAETIVTQVEHTLSALDPYARYKVIIEILEPVKKQPKATNGR